MNTENTNNSAPKELAATTDNLTTATEVTPPLKPKNRLLGLGVCLMTAVLVACAAWLMWYGDGVVREATLLDPWFQGLPVDGYTRMTTAKLGGDSISPLGVFGGYYCCVLEDGSIVIRSSAADGSRKMLVVSDYTVPEEWYGKAVLLDKHNHDVVLVVDRLSVDEYACYRGDIWVWSTMYHSYIYQGTGTALPSDEPTETTKGAVLL